MNFRQRTLSCSCSHKTVKEENSKSIFLKFFLLASFYLIKLISLGHKMHLLLQLMFTKITFHYLDKNACRYKAVPH